MPALVPAGTVATCWPGEAFWMRNVRSEAGLTNWLPMKKLLRSRLISFTRESRASAGVGKFVIVDVGDADSGLGQRMDAGIDHRRRPAHIALRVGSETLERLADIGGDEAVSLLGILLLGQERPIVAIRCPAAPDRRDGLERIDRKSVGVGK